MLHISHKISLLKLMKLSSTFLEFKVKWFRILQKDLMYEEFEFTISHLSYCVEEMRSYVEMKLGSLLEWKMDFGCRSPPLFFEWSSFHRNKKIDHLYPLLQEMSKSIIPCSTMTLRPSWYRCWTWSASVIDRHCWKTIYKNNS